MPRPRVCRPIPIATCLHAVVPSPLSSSPLLPASTTPSLSPPPRPRHSLPPRHHPQVCRPIPIATYLHSAIPEADFLHATIPVATAPKAAVSSLSPSYLRPLSTVEEDQTNASGDDEMPNAPEGHGNDQSQKWHHV
ncbi:uncharacterized protein LOC133898516 [Phragmites australis]|uniref:uncharacterized protein LOC133898516 n=1 Tax=Phragmites australis TaxID=29695 RepID=UPI002D767098|nr:uncharacterized protein LOC133898516 [Phragmites australis]